MKYKFKLSKITLYPKLIKAIQNKIENDSSSEEYSKLTLVIKSNHAKDKYRRLF